METQDDQSLKKGSTKMGSGSLPGTREAAIVSLLELENQSTKNSILHLDNGLCLVPAQIPSLGAFRAV